jgi:signal transduction histidine kinase
VRLIDLPRTSSFRLALCFLLLFGAASFTLLGFLYVQTKHYVISRVDDWVTREQAIFGVMDRPNLLERLEAHRIADPTWERPMALFDPAGGRLAGTPLNVPPATLAAMPRDGIVPFSLPEGGRDLSFRGVVHARPSGDLLLIARDMAGPRDFARVLTDAFIWGGLGTVVLGLVGAAVIGAGVVRRIDGVTSAIQRIVSGDLSERLPAHGRTHDLDRLAHVINGMLGELERLMQEVKGVCDAVAHDLRTPLTRLLAGLERARRRAGSTGDYQAAIDEAIGETKSVLATFAAILRVSEIESGERRAGFTDADVSKVVADAVDFYEPVAEEKGVRLVRSVPASGPVTLRGDPSLLFEAVSNLVDNALKFTPPGGCVKVGGFAGDGVVGFEVVDTGPGIPEDEAASVLRRFYRAETSRNAPGSGLGLALVAAIARLHGMDVSIGNERQGCRVIIARREVGGGLADAAGSAGTPHLR